MDYVVTIDSEVALSTKVKRKLCNRVVCGGASRILHNLKIRRSVAVVWLPVRLREASPGRVLNLEGKPGEVEHTPVGQSKGISSSRGSRSGSKEAVNNRRVHAWSNEGLLGCFLNRHIFPEL